MTNVLIIMVTQYWINGSRGWTPEQLRAMVANPEDIEITEEVQIDKYGNEEIVYKVHFDGMIKRAPKGWGERISDWSNAYELQSK